MSQLSAMYHSARASQPARVFQSQTNYRRPRELCMNAWALLAGDVELRVCVFACVCVATDDCDEDTVCRRRAILTARIQNCAKSYRQLGRRMRVHCATMLYALVLHHQRRLICIMQWCTERVCSTATYILRHCQQSCVSEYGLRACRILCTYVSFPIMLQRNNYMCIEIIRTYSYNYVIIKTVHLRKLDANK